MEKWEEYLRQLLPLPINELHLDRGKRIRNLLDNLSNYPYDSKKKFKNIRENADFAREELRGAVQRFLIGNFLDSIIFSCFSVEFGLLVKLDLVLTDEEKRNVKKPFTFGKIIKKSCDYLSLDSSVEKAAYELLDIRNAHIHGSNFIGALIQSYKGFNKLFEKSGLIDINVITQGLEEITKLLPQDIRISILEKYEPIDFIEAYNAIQSISSFEWAANKRILYAMKKEVDNIITDIPLNIMQEDFLAKFNPDYFLEKRAKRALNVAEKILKGIDII